MRSYIQFGAAKRWRYYFDDGTIEHVFGSLDFGVEHLARSLLSTPRWGGHTRWDVARHSILVCQLAMYHSSTWGVSHAALMHDDHEAVLTDIPSPLKPHLDGIQALESAVSTSIRAQLSTTIRPEDYSAVKPFDTLAGVAEATHTRLFVPGTHTEWTQRVCRAEAIPEHRVAFTHTCVDKLLTSTDASVIGEFVSLFKLTKQ